MKESKHAVEAATKCSHKENHPYRVVVPSKCMKTKSIEYGGTKYAKMILAQQKLYLMGLQIKHIHIGTMTMHVIEDLILRMRE